MTAAIGPGTPLICVDTAGDWLPASHQVTIGALYFCEDVQPRKTFGCNFCTEGFALDIKDKPKHINGRRFWYCSCLFRPLNGGDTSLVDAENAQRQKEKILRHAFNYSNKPLEKI